MGCRVYSYTRFYLAKIVFYMRQRLFLYGILLIYCQVILSRPVLPVQIAVTDGFSQMGGLYQFCTLKVGNGACHF